MYRALLPFLKRCGPSSTMMQPSPIVASADAHEAAPPLPTICPLAFGLPAAPSQQHWRHPGTAACYCQDSQALFLITGSCISHHCYDGVSNVLACVMPLHRRVQPVGWELNFGVITPARGGPTDDDCVLFCIVAQSTIYFI